MFSCNFKLQFLKSSETNLKVGLSNMLNNFQYFLVLAEELNISKAADRLFISHQCLSKYLKNLEDEYGVMFFHRKPKFALTYAGELVLQSLRKIELIDANLSSQLAELQDGKTGEVRIGITQGRLRLLMPDLLDQFKQQYPNVEMRMISNTTHDLIEMLNNNKLDFAVMSDPSIHLPNMQRKILMQEHLYLIISDNLLKQYFPESYPVCKETFANGTDLRLFGNVPFMLNQPGFTSRVMIDRHLSKIGMTLRCVNEATAMDLHHLMTARDYAASFALTMFLTSIHQLSETAISYSELNIFPIKDLQETNPFVMIYPKEKIFPAYTHCAMKLLKSLCQSYADFNA